MEQFFNDLWTHLMFYYDSFIILIPNIFLAIIVFMLSLLIANRVNNFSFQRLNNRIDDPLLAKFIARILKIILILIGIMLVLRIMGLGGIAAGLVTGASVSAIVIGFAFKDIGENFLAGIIMAFNRPFRVNDIVELDGIKGKVIALDLRHSHIKTFDGKDVYIPNANVLKNPLVNYTIDGYLRYDIEFGLDYGSDIKKAIQIILSQVDKEKGILNVDGKKAQVQISKMDSSTLNLILYYWMDTFDNQYSAADIKTNLINNILIALEKEGFYMPGSILEIKNYKDEKIFPLYSKEI